MQVALKMMEREPALVLDGRRPTPAVLVDVRLHRRHAEEPVVLGSAADGHLAARAKCGVGIAPCVVDRRRRGAHDLVAADAGGTLRPRIAGLALEAAGAGVALEAGRAWRPLRVPAELRLQP